jgi:hypothetical protein
MLLLKTLIFTGIYFPELCEMHYNVWVPVISTSTRILENNATIQTVFIDSKWIKISTPSFWTVAVSLQIQ